MPTMRPFIERFFGSLYGACYSNEVLQRTSGLSQQRIRVYMNPNDMREAWAYLPNGAELGRLYVLDGWRYSRHTLRLRRRILRERSYGTVVGYLDRLKKPSSAGRCRQNQASVSWGGYCSQPKRRASGIEP
jgi:hypothetical protein